MAVQSIEREALDCRATLAMTNGSGVVGGGEIAAEREAVTDVEQGFAGI